jgi:glycerol uptake facilitator-like aquaporin
MDTEPLKDSPVLPKVKQGHIPDLRETVSAATETCFFERDPEVALKRRAAVEGFGTLLLVLAVAGSGLMASSLVHEASLLARASSAVATAGALVGLILAFGSVSGGHFNPLISALQWLSGERRLDCMLAYIVAQLAGGVAGALLANIIFGTHRVPIVSAPAAWRLASSELLATAGLLIVVFGCARSGRRESGPFAVGAWLTAATIATPSASYANPAITLAALIAAGPLGLSPRSAAVYVLAQVVGSLLALALITIAYPRRR